MNRRSTLRAAAAGAGLLSLGRAGRALAQVTTVKIGAIYPQSGSPGVSGNAMLAGARIAADEINAQGGVLGRPLEIHARDDKANPAESALVARDLMGSGIKFMLGGIVAPSVRAVIPLLAENDGLLIMASTQMPLTHEEFNPRTFRLQPNSRMILFSPVAAVARRYPNIVKWGTVSPDLEFGHVNWALFQVGMKKFHGANAGKLQFAPPALHKFGATDYKVQIAAILSAGVEGVYAGMFGGDTITFLTQASQLGLFQRVKVLIDSGQGIFPAKSMGMNMPKVDFWSATQWYLEAPKANATSKALAKAYVEMTKDSQADSLAVIGHSAVRAYVAAIRKANSLEVDKVRQALEEVEFETASGQMRFRKEDHQVLMDVPVIKVVQKAGAPGWQVAEVAAVKAADAVEPPAPGKKYEEG
jgi:branched-chain amino acid transport system substrate-binding protein